MVWRAPTVQIAAERLMRLAISRSWEKVGRLKDDMTCVVVDLNPSIIVTGRGGACCVVC